MRLLSRLKQKYSKPKLENRVCSCGKSYVLVNGELEDNFCDLLLHMAEYHPEYMKTSLERNCVDDRQAESEAYSLARVA